MNLWMPKEYEDMSFEPNPTEKEIITSINNMHNAVIHIERDNYPPNIKAESKTLLITALDFLLEQTSPNVINGLVVDEYRKRNKKI